MITERKDAEKKYGFDIWKKAQKPFTKLGEKS